MSKEIEHQTLKEKVIWYAKYGGIVAGLIGLLINKVQMVAVGITAAVGGFVFEKKTR